MPIVATRPPRAAAGSREDGEGLVKLATEGAERAPSQAGRRQVELEVEAVHLNSHPGVVGVRPHRVVEWQWPAGRIDQEQLQLGADGERAGAEARPGKQLAQRRQAALQAFAEAVVVELLEVLPLDASARVDVLSGPRTTSPTYPATAPSRNGRRSLRARAGRRSGHPRARSAHGPGGLVAAGRMAVVVARPRRKAVPGRARPSPGRTVEANDGTNRTCGRRGRRRDRRLRGRAAPVRPRGPARAGRRRTAGLVRLGAVVRLDLRLRRRPGRRLRARLRGHGKLGALGGAAGRAGRLPPRRAGALGGRPGRRPGAGRTGRPCPGARLPGAAGQRGAAAGAAARRRAGPGRRRLLCRGRRAGRRAQGPRGQPCRAGTGRCRVADRPPRPAAAGRRGDPAGGRRRAAAARQGGAGRRRRVAGGRRRGRPGRPDRAQPGHAAADHPGGAAGGGGGVPARAAGPAGAPAPARRPRCAGPPRGAGRRALPGAGRRRPDPAPRPQAARPGGKVLPRRCAAPASSG
jgi:hypothetical protein